MTTNMNDRDAQIVELAKSGMSARKIGARLKLPIDSRKVNKIIRRELGPVKPGNNSAHNSLYIIRPLIEQLMIDELGKDPFTCEICGESQDDHCEIHHTKYEGATIYDLLFVCRSCNLSHVNKGLV